MTSGVYLRTKEYKERLKQTALKRLKENKNFGFKKENNFRFSKGHTSWLKGTKGLVKPNSGSFKKGHISWLKGLKGYNKGKKNPSWKGGITPENRKFRTNIEFRLWRESVFARDNWTCQKYGIKGGKLNPHHIKNFAQYPELRFAIDNGITLSVKAHREFHKKYGYKNNTKEQLEEFLLK